MRKSPQKAKTEALAKRLPTTREEKGNSDGTADEATSKTGSIGIGEKSLVENWELASETRFEPPPGLAKMELDELAGKISSRLAKIESAIFSVKKHAELALRAAIETGHYLEESARKSKKGEWGAWLVKHCPGLARSTAHKYRTLARNVSHVRHGVPMQTLRQAYIAVGLVPRPSQESKTSPDLTDAPSVTPANFLAGLKASRGFLQTVKGMPLEKMEPEFLKELSDELSQLIAVCSEMKKQVAAIKK
jgi:hypothetical protein